MSRAPDNQLALIHEDIDEAIDSLVVALGGHKKVASDLWPGMSLNSAYARLKNCLRDDKPEKLSPGELITLMKWGHAKGVHIVMSFICGEVGYEETQPVNAESEREKLMREYVEATNQMATLAKKMERYANG